MITLDAACLVAENFAREANDSETSDTPRRIQAFPDAFNPEHITVVASNLVMQEIDRLFTKWLYWHIPDGWMLDHAFERMLSINSTGRVKAGDREEDDEPWSLVFNLYTGTTAQSLAEQYPDDVRETR